VTYTLVIGCQTIAVGNPATTSGIADAPFSQTFTQSGAIGSATFTTASTLPTGLTLAANGVLSGTPTQTGTFPIVVMVTDANGCAGLGATYTLVINCQTFSVEPTSVPPATAGSLYPAVAFKHAGGIGTVTFSETGALPTGMNLVGGLLLGTPTQTGSFPFTVTATDANGCTASRDYVLVVSCVGVAITLAPASLPTVVVGSAFPATTFTASGGTGAYTFQQIGALPSGMQFLTDTLSGTPTQTGAFPITVVAKDAAGCVGSQDYVVTVTCDGVTITVAPPTVPSVSAGSPFGPVTFTASGGTGPYTFVKAGVLPTGMNFGPDTLSGSPTQQGTFPFTVTATDANGCTGSTTYSLVVTCPTITITNPATATGTVSAAFSQTFTQSGGALPVTFSLGSGTLPAGLTLDSATGVVSGTPTQSGSFPVTVKATDANGCTGTGPTYTLVIACQTITVSNPVVNSGADGAPFLQTFTQTGAVGGATFSLGSGSLPGGWSLTPAGVLANAAPTPVQFSITVKVTDGNGCTGTGATYTVSILPNVVNDTYAPAIVGNMSIDTATGTAFSVLSNDSAGTTANLVGGGTTAQGGTVSLDSLGRFTYQPPRGYEGPDSFQYTATHTASGLTSAPATVSLTVAGMVWFVNNNAGACVSSCDGRQTNPYTALDLFQAVNTGTPTNPKAGDSVFLYESATAYTSPAAAPVALLNNQKLIGQDFAGTFAAATGLTVPDTTVGVPVLTPGAPFSTVASVAGQNIVLLASGNTIRGLTLSPANNAAVAFVGPGSIGTATVDQVILSLAGSGSGIGLALHTGTLNVQNSSIVGGGTGTAVAVSGAANGSAVFTNTPVTRTGGRLLDVQSRTAGGAVTFDAASVLTLTGAATDGIVLQNNASTTLSLLGGFSVTTTAGRGFLANNTGTVTIGGASNLINATGGAALDVTATTIAGSPTFTSVSSTNPASQGILLSNAGGGFTIGTTTVSGSGTQRILVTGSTVSAAFGNTTLNGGSDAVSLQNNSAGTRSFGTLTIGNTTPPTGVGFLHAVGGGTTTVSGATTITNGAANGIDIQNSASTITFSGVAITKTSGTGVNLVNDTSVTFGALSVTSPASGSGLVSTGSSVSTTGGTIAVTGGPAVSATTTNFNASSLASVSSTNSASQGVSLTTCSGSLTMSAGSITGATLIPFVVNGGTVSAAYAGGITQSAANPMVSVSGGHATGTITFQTGTLSATNGSGLQFDNADGIYAFNGTTTLSGGDAGIDILNGSSGSFTFGSATSINNPTGIAYREDTSTATVAFDGTITKNNNAANAVRINAKTGGSSTFSGAIVASTTSANAIDLTNTGGTVTFRGGLSATTTSGVAFNATGSGATVAVCDENPCNPGATGALVNTLTSTTGTALNVANSSIGSNNLEFRSISSNGAANGIVLNTTGASGGLKVKGNGTSGSGGTIQNATADGISLTNTRDVSIDRMIIQNTAQNGIDGTGVVNFAFTNGTISNTGTAGGGQFEESLIAFNDSTTFTENNVSGTVTITGNTLTQPRRNGIDISNWSGTISNLIISNNTLTGGTTTASILHAIIVFSQGSASTTGHITTGKIQNNTISGFRFLSGGIFIGGSGIFVAGGNTGASTVATIGAAGTPIEISGNDVDFMGSNGIVVSFNGQQGLSNFNIHDNGTVANPMSNMEGLGISVFFGGNGTFSALVNNNAISTNGPTVHAGSAGIGVQVDQGTLATDAPVATITVNNNSVVSPDGNGIRGIVRNSNGTLSLKVQNNTVGAPFLANRNGIRIDGGSATGNTTLLLNLSGNTSAGSGVNQGIGLRKQGVVAGTNSFGINALAPSPATAAQTATYVSGLNPAGSGVDIISGDNFVTCSLP
jgi:hypothetical protein